MLNIAPQKTVFTEY